LTDLISLAETKEPVVTETVEVQTLAEFSEQTEEEATDESYW
jgi:hypothetical protein